MPWKQLSAQQKAVDKLVQSVNRKIAGIAAKLGTDSRAYKQIEDILWGMNAAGKRVQRYNVGSAGFVRDKNGIVQISRSTKALANLEIKNYMKALRKIAQLPTAAQIEKKIIQAYEETHGVKIKGKANKQQIVQQALQKDLSLGSRLDQALQALYTLRDQIGMELKTISDIKSLSKGRYTSQDDLEKMIELAEAEIAKEDHEIQEDLFAGF